MNNQSTKKCGRPIGYRKPDSKYPEEVRAFWRAQKENWKIKKNPVEKY